MHLDSYNIDSVFYLPPSIQYSERQGSQSHAEYYGGDGTDVG